MFTSFARRLTAWYVVAATVLVFAVMTLFAAFALAMYGRIVNEGIDDGLRDAATFAARAAQRHEAFGAAARDFEARTHRSGVRMFGIEHPSPPPGTPPPAPAPRATPLPVVVENAIVQRRDARPLRGEGSRFGLALATAAGTHFEHTDFLDGQFYLTADPQAFQNYALGLIALIVGVSTLVGVLGWAVGRYITTQALRPLVDVTHALQRFAARDFTPAAIAVAGKSEFDAIALAYNAAAAQVAAAFAEREAAETQMRQFVADAGHELRTPLTIVLGYTDLLRRRAEAGDERAQRIFTAIGAEGARMRTLIDNLVLLARMEGADLRPAEPFGLRGLVDEIVDGRRLIAPGVRFDVDLAVEATVIGNREEIHEALANVVDNALKYAPGSPIRLRSRIADGGVEITVEDEGPGIAAGDRDAIFDRFYRGAARGDVEGSGLGLAIAKRAVERAGGGLRLESSSPHGTTFALRLRTDGPPRSEQPAVTRR